MIRAALLAALVVIAGSFEITRPGYSVDEEFTEFAVRGIREHGLPILPSGLLYDRGIAYSYASAAIDGRVVSLVCAALTLVLTSLLVRRVNWYAALIAPLLVATSVPFWATATTARFYAPFLLLCLGTLVTLSNPALGTIGTLGTLGALAFIARLSHELAFFFAAVPAVAVFMDRNNWRKWLKATAAIVTGLLLAQAPPNPGSCEGCVHRRARGEATRRGVQSQWRRLAARSDHRDRHLQGVPDRQFAFVVTESDRRRRFTGDATARNAAGACASGVTTGTARGRRPACFVTEAQ